MTDRAKGQAQQAKCPCLSFERADPDDSLCFECACGHVSEEHESGFLRSCTMGRIDDDD